MNHRLNNLKRYLAEAGVGTTIVTLGKQDLLLASPRVIMWSDPEQVFIVIRMNTIRPGKMQQVNTLVDTVKEVLDIIKENSDGLKTTSKTQVL